MADRCATNDGSYRRPERRRRSAHRDESAAGRSAAIPVIHSNCFSKQTLNEFPTYSPNGSIRRYPADLYRLIHACLEPDESIAQLTGPGLQRQQNLARDAAAPELGQDEHALDLTCTQFQDAQRPASNGTTVNSRNQEGEIGICQILRMQAV